MLRNRIVFGAHTANMAENGLPTERHVAYYAERAIGGAGMIVVEPMPVHPATVLTRGNFRPSDDAVIPHFAKVARAIFATTLAVRRPTSTNEPSINASDQVRNFI